MIFISEFGVGEIVIYAPHKPEGSKPLDALLEVQGVYFSFDGKTEYVCRYPGTGVTTTFSESQLTGDPEFSQESGYD